MSEEKRSPTERVRAMLDEQGVEWYERKVNKCTSFCFDYCPQCDDYRKEIIVAGEYIEMVQKYLTPEQAIAATVGKDIEHYDGSGRRGTVAILQGGREPEEVLFAREGGGVTHYLPEGAGTCKDLGSIGANGEQVFHCSECGCVMSLYDRDGSNNLCTSFVYEYPRFCPECGRKVIETKEEAE